MMVGTVLGPGTIFLMLVGAFSVAFKVKSFSSTKVWLPLLLIIFSMELLKPKGPFK